MQHYFISSLTLVKITVDKKHSCLVFIFVNGIQLQIVINADALGPICQITDFVNLYCATQSTMKQIQIERTERKLKESVVVVCNISEKL